MCVLGVLVGVLSEYPNMSFGKETRITSTHEPTSEFLTTVPLVPHGVPVVLFPFLDFFTPSYQFPCVLFPSIDFFTPSYQFLFQS